MIKIFSPEAKKPYEWHPTTTISFSEMPKNARKNNQLLFKINTIFKLKKS